MPERFMAAEPGTDLLTILATKMSGIHEDLVELRAGQQQISDAVSRLVRLEERQSASNDAIKRIADRVDKVEARVHHLEVKQPLLKQSAEWVNRAVWAGAAALLTILIKQTGLL